MIQDKNNIEEKVVDYWTKRVADFSDVREKKLIILALIGGSIGAMIGMTVFQHKTRKWYFRLGIPLILGIQVSLVLCFYDMM